ncbi:MAG: hypothetical protein BGO51_27505 [Rhodospirillales bacterium 69-11]|nr:MAG: hypothetical protein BGO51_27505 [Rhodospirillales bacterium 69-11]
MDPASIFGPAAQAALTAFGVTAAELRFVHHSENVTFRVVDARDGGALVLRLHRPWYHDLAELESEHAWTRALVRAGIAAPEPLPTTDGAAFAQVTVAATGEQRWAGLARWVDGELLAEIVSRETNAAAAARHFVELGAVMARMHDQATAWTPPAGFKRHALDEDGLMGSTPFWGPFWDHPIFSAAERDLMLATRATLRAALLRYGKAPHVYSMIHADLHPKNVVIGDGSAAVIDFDDAGFGWHVYDLAVALVAYERHPHFTAFRDACLAGYRAVRPLAEADAALLPMFLLVRNLAQIGWYHQRPELPPAPGLPALKQAVCSAAAAFAG